MSECCLVDFVHWDVFSWGGERTTRIRALYHVCIMLHHLFPSVFLVPSWEVLQSGLHPCAARFQQRFMLLLLLSQSNALCTLHLHVYCGTAVLPCQMAGSLAWHVSTFLQPSTMEGQSESYRQSAKSAKESELSHNIFRFWRFAELSMISFLLGSSRKPVAFCGSKGAEGWARFARVVHSRHCWYPRTCKIGRFSGCFEHDWVRLVRAGQPRENVGIFWKLGAPTWSFPSVSF